MFVDAFLSRVVVERQVDRPDKCPDWIDDQKEQQTGPASSTEDRERNAGERHDHVAQIGSEIFAVGLRSIVRQREETNHHHQRVEMNENPTVDALMRTRLDSSARRQVGEKQSIVNEQTSTDRHR